MTNRMLAQVFGSDSKFAKEPLAFAICVILVLIWSGWFVLSRWGVTGGTLSSFDITFLRFFIGAIFAIPFFWMWKNEKIAWRALLIMAPAYGVIYLFAFFHALKTTPVANAGILINGTLPIINGLLAFVLLKGTISKGKWIAIVLLAVANGCMFIAGAKDASLNWGWGFVLISAVSFGVYMTVYRQYPINYYVLIPLLPIINLVLLLPIYPFVQSNLLDAPVSEIMVQSFYQGVIVQVLGMYLLAYAIPRLGSVTSSVIFGFLPATTAIMGWIFLSEAVVWLEIIGIVGCTVGIIMFGRSK